MRRITITLVLTLLAGLTVGTASSQAAAKRVVALEWDAVENLSAVGITPIGIADSRGYDAFVGAPRRKGSAEVGLRSAPSLERIRRLKPDLIVVPDYRSTKNRDALKKIAPVLVTSPYRGSGNAAHFNNMVRDFRRVAKAVGRSSQGERVLRAMTGKFAAQKAALRQKRRAGTGVVVAEPGGTTSTPALRLMTNNSLTAEVLRRIGLRNAWTGPNAFYGFTTSSIGSLAKIRGNEWLAFVYPEQYRSQIQKYRELKAFAKLPVVRSRHYRNLQGRTWLYGGPVSTGQIADQLGAAIRRG
ncbi:MAG: iron-siderophore ABC transporter substrate-binding protein [Patulibacter sp.]